MKNRKILIILGHSYKKGLCGSLADEYEKGTRESGAVIRRINLGDLKFDPILHEGYRIIQKLEPDLVKAQKDIKWADKIVFVYPVWWMSMPALLKGFFDRTLLPSFAFHFESAISWKKLLKGKSAELLITMDAAKIFYRFMGSISEKVMKNTLNFCGIKTKRITIFDLVENVSEKRKNKFLKTAYKLGMKN